MKPECEQGKARAYWDRPFGVVLSIHDGNARVYLDTIEIRTLLQELSLALDHAIDAEWRQNHPIEDADNERRIAEYHAAIP